MRTKKIQLNDSFMQKNIEAPLKSSRLTDKDMDNSLFSDAGDEKMIRGLVMSCGKHSSENPKSKNNINKSWGKGI